MRGINSQFVEDLNSGCLSWFLRQVKTHGELALEIRQGYINIYYKGGNALRIRQNQRSYRFAFDAKYCLEESTREKVKAFRSLEDYRDNFGLLLSEMDNWFYKHPKEERKLQHDLIRLNTTGFCVLDIEYAGSYELGGKRKSFRLDMLAVHEGKIIIVENKKGERAMGSKAGIKKHYDDICAIIDSPDTKTSLISSMHNIAGNKKALGLSYAAITDEDIEILFLIFDPNKRSRMLGNQLATISKSHPAKVIYMSDAEKIDYDKAQILI